MNAKLMIIYGIGHFGKTLLWSASGLTFAFFLTEVVGFRPLLMGQILALSLVFNALSDVAVGRWLRARVTDLRTAGIAHALGATAAAAAFVAFANTRNIAEPFQLGFAVTTLFLFRLGYSVFDVPQNTMLALSVGSDAMRARMTAVRYIAAGLATIVVAAFLNTWISMPEPQSRSTAYVALAMVLGGLAVATAIATATATATAPDWVRTIAGSGSQASAAHYTFGPVLLSIAIYSGLMTVFVKLQPYFVAYGPSRSFAATQFITIVALGQIASQPFWAWLGRTYTLATTYVVAASALAAVGVAFSLVAQLNVYALAAIAVAFGAASSGTLMAIWSLMASVAAGLHASSVAQFGTFTFVSKSAQAIGILGVGLILDKGLYRTNSGGENVTVAMSSVVTITGVTCALVAIHLLSQRRVMRK